MFRQQKNSRTKQQLDKLEKVEKVDKLTAVCMFYMKKDLFTYEKVVCVKEKLLLLLELEMKCK